MGKDSRLSVGAEVHTKARYVTSDAEFQRRYVSLCKTRTVAGGVEKTRQEQGKTNHVTFIGAASEVGSQKIRKALQLRFVKIGSCPIPTQPDGKPDFIGREPVPSSPIQTARTLPLDGEAGCFVQVGSPNVQQLPHDSDTEHNLITEFEDIAVPSNSMRHRTVAYTSPSTVPTAKNCSLSDVGTVEVHEKLWRKASVLSDLNGPVPVKHWKVVGFDRPDIRGRGAPAGNGLEYYFHSMSPMRFLRHIVQLTSNDLLSKHQRGTSAGEILRFFGILI